MEGYTRRPMEQKDSHKIDPINVVFSTNGGRTTGHPHTKG
jgi:hypothetical protein